MVINLTTILITSLIGVVVSNLNYSVILQYEKNKYISVLKENPAVFNLLSGLKQIDFINRHAVSFFFLGLFVGYVYFNLAMIVIIKVLVFITANNLDIFYLNINPYIGVNGKLIDAAYFNFTILLLAIIWYFIYKDVKLNIIPGQSITWIFKVKMYSLCILVGSIFISITLISIYIFKSIIPEFVITVDAYATILLSPAFILGYLFSYLCVKLSYNKISNAKKESEISISEFYEMGYPCVTISTTSNKIDGQIKSIIDRTVLIIIDKHKNTIAIPWSNITFIKILDS